MNERWASCYPSSSGVFKHYYGSEAGQTSDNIILFSKSFNELFYFFFEVLKKYETIKGRKKLEGEQKQ